MSSITVSKIESQSQEGCLSLPDLDPGGGCCDATICSVQIINNNASSTCYCDKTCYRFDDCCDDIVEIGCIGNLPKACHCVYKNACFGDRCWLARTRPTRDGYHNFSQATLVHKILQLLSGVFVYCVFGACI